MKKVFSILILALILINGFTQNNFPIEKFGFNSELKKIQTKTNVGFFVKGNKNNIQNLCESYSGKYISSIKGWHYIRLSPTNITDFTNEEQITQHYIPFETGEPHNDTMRVNNRINDAHNGSSPLSSSYSGNGVIMGFIDTGIDFNNADFKNIDGSTRIISLWDQTITGTSTKFGYGTDWDSIQINAGLPSSHNDQYGHGTTVAGAGAGNGLANGKNKGVAYNSDMIVVEVDFGSNFLSNVQDATQYIYRIADSLGKPCVINASAGTYFGSHDGLDPNALYIDSLINASSGHLFVCSAGNKGGNNFHLQHNSPANDTLFTLFKHNPSLNYAPYGCVPYCYGSNSVHFTAYADVSNFNNVKIAMSAYTGTHKSGTSSYFTIADYLAGNLYQDSYGAYVDSIVNENNQRIGLQFMFASLLYGSVYQFEIIVSPDSVSNYLWGFQTTGTGKCDIWSDNATYSKSDMVSSSDIEFPFPSKPMNYVDPDTLQNMCSSFQCSPNVITVANYNNESGYINNEGNWVNLGGNRGEISPSSGSGPTRNGLIKPDLAASGEATVSSYPGYLLSFFTDAQLGQGGLHYKNGGTSMASPVVAGVAALYLEKCNLATNAKFKTDLINSVYTDSWVGSTPNHLFGHGKLDGFSTLVNSVTNDTTTITACKSYAWKSTIYDSTGVYFDSTSNSFGCDSISILNLTINNEYDDTIQASSCNTYTWDGITYTSSGFFLNTYTSISGCDSIVTLNLTIDSSVNSNDIQNACSSFTWIDGNTYTSNNNTATHSLTSSLGCDSIITLNLTINAANNDTLIVNACDSFTWNSINYSNSGTYIDTLANIYGCDSISLLSLSINYSYFDTTTITSCDSYNWNGQNYFLTGFYADSLNTANGCDSILYLDLTINNSFRDTAFITECDSFLWNSINYTSTGLYINSATTALGCDSIHYLKLTINNSSNDTIEMSTCDTLFWNSNTYTSNGLYSGSFLNATGCDSSVTIDLKINSNEGTPLEFKLILDDYCMETYWTVKDSDDSTWYNVGPYDCNPNGGGNQANDTVITDVYLPENDCYTLTLHDYYNDGMSASSWGGTDGSWIITEKNGNVISQGEGNFGSSISVDFYVTSAIPSNIKNNSFENYIKAYPNPFNERTTINIKGINPPFNFDLVDISGRIAKSFNINSNSFELYNDNFETGIYWLILKNHPINSTIKLVVY